MKTLLIGANGQLGSDINKVFSADSAYQLIPTVREELDITKTDDIQNALKKYSPELIISTAAFHRVDVCENEPDKAFQVNALAVSGLAKICHTQNIVLVHFSTDYVFGADKERNKPYTEDDSPGPVNAYGLSKLAGEYFVKYLFEKYFLVRTCGLYGIAGPAEKKGNFVDNIVAKSNEHKEISVVNDQILTPTYTLDLANNLKELLKTRNYGLYHITSEGQCSWYEFAKEIIKNLAADTTVKSVSTADFYSPVNRPGYSVLENSRLNKIGLNLMKPWQDALKSYMQEKNYLDIL